MRIFSLLLIVLFFSCGMQSNKEKKTAWDIDLDYLASELAKKHYHLFSVKSKADYLNELELIRKEAGGLTDFEITMKLQQLIASCGDSHTKVIYHKMLDSKQVLPLQLNWFKDAYYIMGSSKENQDLLACRLLSVNGIPMEEIVTRLSTLLTVDNRALQIKSIPSLFPFVQILRYFEIVKEDGIELQVQNQKGEIVNRKIQPAILNRNNYIGFQADSTALCNLNRRIYFIDYYREKDSIYYVQYNKCLNREFDQMRGRKDAHTKPSFKEFSKKVLDHLENQPIDKFVFDMRFNSGGNSSYGTGLIEKIAAVQKKRPNLKLYVVLGRHTFSSAILNAMDFKRLTNAIYVGEATAGKPNHFGEILELKLPKSGIGILYSTKYFKKTDEDIKTMEPDVVLETSFEDYARGIDPVYDWIQQQ